MLNLVGVLVSVRGLRIASVGETYIDEKNIHVLRSLD